MAAAVRAVFDRVKQSKNGVARTRCTRGEVATRASAETAGRAIRPWKNGDEEFSTSAAGGSHSRKVTMKNAYDDTTPSTKFPSESSGSRRDRLD